MHLVALKGTLLIAEAGHAGRVPFNSGPGAIRLLVGIRLPNSGLRAIGSPLIIGEIRMIT